MHWVIFAETLHLKCEVGRSPFPSGDIYSINMTYRGVEICFARSCKHQQNRFALFFVFIPTEFTVPELCDDNAVYRIGF